MRLKDGREVAVRFLRVDDKLGLFHMFSSLSSDALEWSMAPYTMDVIQRWIGNLHNLIPPLIVEHDKKVVCYASIYKPPHQRIKGVGGLLVYLHQIHNVGLG
ncbi:MAG: hypothetical protein WCC63_03155, partial [Candidatus Bathyarchaeia archaeon]